MNIRINLSEDEIKRWNINDKICCIYLLRNIINGKMYVGQTRDLRKRISRYHTEANKPGISRLIVESIKYFGESSFELSILQHCDISELDKYENEWINRLRTYDEEFGYNVMSKIMVKTDKEAESMRKSLAHIGLKASSESKKKRSNIVIAISNDSFIIADSAKLLGDFLETSKDMIKNCLRLPSAYKGWYIFYDDFDKRNSIRDKMLRKRSIRNKSYMNYLNMLNDYEFESVETIYAFVRANIGHMYLLSYDYINEDDAPCIVEICSDYGGRLYINDTDKLLLI